MANKSCEAMLEGARKMLTEAGEAARAFAARVNDEIYRLNRREGTRIYYRLIVRERRQGMELHWHRMFAPQASQSKGGASRLRSAYVSGLRGIRYRSDAFTGLSVAHRSRVLTYEIEAMEHRQRIRALVQLCRTLEELIGIMPDDPKDAPWLRSEDFTLDLQKLME